MFCRRGIFYKFLALLAVLGVPDEITSPFLSIGGNLTYSFDFSTPNIDPELSS